MARGAPKKGVLTHSLAAPKMLRKVPKAMKELRDELLDYRAEFHQMPAELAAGMREVFASNGGAIGASWSKNSEEYRKRKAREGRGNRPMKYTGKLIAQLTSPTGPRVSVSKRKLTWKTRKLPYARALHFKLGKRFFGLSGRTAKRIAEIMDRGSLEKLNRATKALEASRGR